MIQYIRIETDDSGEIIGMEKVRGEPCSDPCIDCSSAYLAVKKVLSETSGLPKEACTTDHISKITKELSHPYLLAKQKLSAESGLEDFCTVEEHLAAIKSKALVEGINDGAKHAKNVVAMHSGLDRRNDVGDHIAAIKLKAYDQGYDKGWHDKQADIQKRIKQFEDTTKMELAKASGLPEASETTDHIEAIREKAVEDDNSQKASIFHALAEASGLHESNHNVQDHVDKIVDKTMNEAADCTRKFMAKYSGEFWDRFTVAGHIEQIKRNSMKAGATMERNRIQGKIEELLS